MGAQHVEHATGVAGDISPAGQRAQILAVPIWTPKVPEPQSVTTSAVHLPLPVVKVSAGPQVATGRSTAFCEEELVGPVCAGAGAAGQEVQDMLVGPSAARHAPRHSPTWR